jgi:hypothetical protein
MVLGKQSRRYIVHSSMITWPFFVLPHPVKSTLLLVISSQTLPNRPYPQTHLLHKPNHLPQIPHSTSIQIIQHHQIPSLLDLPLEGLHLLLRCIRLTLLPVLHVDTPPDDGGVLFGRDVAEQGSAGAGAEGAIEWAELGR